MFSFPLRENPFFAKVSSMQANMEVDGILINDTDMRGYSCQTIGDLECDHGEMPACSGESGLDQTLNDSCKEVHKGEIKADNAKPNHNINI